MVEARTTRIYLKVFVKSLQDTDWCYEEIIFEIHTDTFSAPEKRSTIRYPKWNRSYLGCNLCIKNIKKRV